MYIHIKWYIYICIYTYVQINQLNFQILTASCVVKPPLNIIHWDSTAKNIPRDGFDFDDVAFKIYTLTDGSPPINISIIESCIFLHDMYMRYLYIYICMYIYVYIYILFPPKYIVTRDIIWIITIILFSTAFPGFRTPHIVATDQLRPEIFHENMELNALWRKKGRAARLMMRLRMGDDGESWGTRVKAFDSYWLIHIKSLWLCQNSDWNWP